MRKIFPALLLLASASVAVAATKNEYKAADANIYLPADAQDSEPILSKGVTHTGDSYFVMGKKKAAPVVYVEDKREWLEPLSPPDGTPLDIKPDAMDLRDVQGDVSVQGPGGGAFVPATEKMPLINGAVVKTGAGGTAVVLFGGVASTRFSPNSEAAVQQNITPAERSEQIDLRVGIAFAKVGTLVGQKNDLKVITATATAESHGGDFAVAQMSNRVDLFLASGAAKLTANGKAMKAVALGITRAPVLADKAVAAAADAETLGAIFNFIPTANTKLKALRDSLGSGAQLSKAQKAYVARIVRVPVLTKLAYVPPPAPPAPVATTPPAAAKPATPAAAPAGSTAMAASADSAKKTSHKKKKTTETATAEITPIPARRIGDTSAPASDTAAVTPSMSTATSAPAPMIKPSAPTMQLRDTSGSSSSSVYNPNGITTGPNSTVP